MEIFLGHCVQAPATVFKYVCVICNSAKISAYTELSRPHHGANVSSQARNAACLS